MNEAEKMVISLYPENLKGLDLSFDESIYAIAFGLQDEIREYGKEAVFNGLGMSAEKMHERVEYCLGKKMYDGYANALRLVLNGNNAAHVDVERLAETFTFAVSNLCQPTDASIDYCSYRADVNYRHLLTQDEIKMQHEPNAQHELVPSDVDNSTEQLYAQVQQLMDEVRFYDEKRDQALERIEELMVEIKQRQDCPKDFGMKNGSQRIKLHEASNQIAWPYRSAEVIRKLGLKTIDEVIQYFGDFNNFVESKDVTLLEWWVITIILRKEELLPATHYAVKLDDEIDQLELSVRANHVLKWSRIYDFDDFAICFASGAEDGLKHVREMRHCGKVTYDEIVQKLGEVSVELDDSLYYLTPVSHVRALDFDRRNRKRLLSCGIDTVGELLAACQSQNRFFGLRYVDNKLYREAKAHLNRYGFSC